MNRKSRGRHGKDPALREAILEYLVLFWEFFKIGVFTIGGGAAMIPQMQQIAVDEKKWLTSEEMLDCIALGTSLPGVIAVNMATYIGYKKRKIKGAVTATVGVVIPAFLAIVIVMAFLEYIGDNSYVEGAFIGVKSAVCGLIIVTAFRLFRQMLPSGGDARFLPDTVFISIMAAGSLIAIIVFNITAVLVILSGIAAGIAYRCISAAKPPEEDDR